MNDQITITTAGLNMGFTLVPDFLLDNDCLTPDAMFLAADLLRERGNRRTDVIIVSKRLLARKMGGGAGEAGTTRIRRAKDELTASFPAIFQITPGDPRTSTPETITVNRDEMLLEHGRYVARREYARAGQSGRQPRAVTVRLSDRRAVVIDPDGNEAERGEEADPRDAASHPLGHSVPPLGRSVPSTKTFLKDQEDTYPLSADADRDMGVGETAAETGEQSHFVKASSTPTAKAKKDRKSRSSGTTSAARAAAELRPFLDAWNTHRNPDRMAQHRGLDDQQVTSLRKLIDAHPDVEAALASWTLAVQKVAAVDCAQPRNWWGDASAPRRTLINLARNWGTHAVEFAPTAAPVVVTPSNWIPSEDIL